MPTGVTCTVYADGVRLADGAETDDPLAPTVLDELQIDWGRETTVDQPDASTCSFTILDEAGGATFTELLRTGTRIDVLATGMLYPDPTEPTWPDPGFESGTLPGLRLTNTTATLTDTRAAGGSNSLLLEPVDRHQGSRTVIAPAAYVPAGTSPDAWDDIPTTDPGQTWTYGATVYAPAGATVTIRPVLFSSPWRQTPVTVLDVPLVVDGADDWITTTGTFTPDVAGAWVGLDVRIYPAGQTWDTTDPTLTWDALAATDPARTWDDYGLIYLDDITILAPAAGTESAVLVYSGRVTSLSLVYDPDTEAPIVTVGCSDFTSDLENVTVGDNPWAVETMADRFTRILDLTGMDVVADIDPTLGAIPVSWRDVDAQGATGLLTELASSVDGVMWSATHQVTGPYLVVEDPAGRASQYILTLDPDTGTVIIVQNADVAGVEISACDVLRDDVTWTQDTQDVMTRAAVTWLEQGIDEDGKNTTTDRTYTLVDEPLEADLGKRAISLSTQLQAEPDAVDVANRLLARTSAQDWRASALTIDDGLNDGSDDEDVTRLLTLLDGTRRNGAPLRLVDMPDWSPSGTEVGVYLEGGTYTYKGGAWILAMLVSNATGLGGSATWDDIATAGPTWTWDDFDPAITWDDLRGIGTATTEEGE